MEQYTFFQPNNVLTVRDLTAYLRGLLESDEVLQDIWIEGEISNFSRPSSGHLYFTLKDSEAAIRCVMWRNATQRLAFTPREGLSVQAHGSLSVYEVTGQVQLYVDTLKPAGEGALFQEFLRLKAKLEAEGLFNPDRKRPIPTMPNTIGIVTSPTGAALQDMLDTLRRRYPVVEVILAPTAVQGIDAPTGIVAALDRLNREVHPDVILIGRGGGSIEDLWAFNDEAVVRAVAASEAPIISGVGHETDFTLTDFAADLRAPTPTAAAEVATPDRTELLGTLADISRQQTSRLRETLASWQWELSECQHTLDRLSPIHALDTYRQRLDEITLRLDKSMPHRIDRIRLQMAEVQRTLQNLNPQAVLKRGYAIVTRQADGSLVKDASKINLDDSIHIRVSRGSFDAQITKTKPGDTG